MKKCSKCNVMQSTNNFYSDKKSKDGFRSYCKDCNNLEAKKWAKNNKDKVNASKRIRYAHNPEQHLNNTKKWQKANPDKVKKASTNYYAKNKSIIIEKSKNFRLANPEYQLNWQRDNPDKVAAANNRRRKLKYKNTSFVISKSFMKRLYASPCVICGSKENIEADHIIPLSRGGNDSEGNLQPLCRSCNASKNAKTIKEWQMSLANVRLNSERSNNE